MAARRAALEAPERSSQQQCATYRENARKRSHIEAFSRDFLSSLASALNDGTRTMLCDDLRRIRDTACHDDADTPLTPAAMILRARRRIGQDNDAYLQCGLMVLWGGEHPLPVVAQPLGPPTTAWPQ